MVSRQEVAEREGVDPEQISRLADLGILQPSRGGTLSTGDVRIARVVDGLERAGVPLEAMAKALEQGELSLAFLDIPLRLHTARRRA